MERMGKQFKCGTVADGSGRMRTAHDLGIPREENVHAAIVVGYPDENYQAPAGRKRVRPRVFSPTRSSDS